MSWNKFTLYTSAIDFLMYFVFVAIRGEASFVLWCAKRQAKSRPCGLWLPRELACVGGVFSTNEGARLKRRWAGWSSSINISFCIQASVGPWLHDIVLFMECKCKEQYCKIVWDLLNVEEKRVDGHERLHLTSALDPTTTVNSILWFFKMSMPFGSALSFVHF